MTHMIVDTATEQQALEWASQYLIVRKKGDCFQVTFKPPKHHCRKEKSKFEDLEKRLQAVERWIDAEDARALEASEY